MRVSDEELKRRDAGFRKVEAGGFELTPFAKLTLDLIDARDALAKARERIAEMENPGRTQYCIGCHEQAKRIAELERILTTLRADLSNEADYCADGGPNEAMRWLARLEQIEQEAPKVPR